MLREGFVMRRGRADGTGIAAPPVGVTGRNAFGLPVGDMPVYTLRHTRTGETRAVTDPGRALITGKWQDIGRFKGPILRGLAGRAPYFPQRFRGNARRRRELLRHALQARSHRAAEERPRGVLAVAVRLERKTFSIRILAGPEERISLSMSHLAPGASPEMRTS